MEVLLSVQEKKCVKSYYLKYQNNINIYSSNETKLFSGVDSVEEPDR